MMKLKTELEDRFGKMPAELSNLFSFVKIKEICKNMLISKLTVWPKSLSIEFHCSATISLSKLMAKMQQDKTFTLEGNNLISLSVICNTDQDIVNALHRIAELFE